MNILITGGAGFIGSQFVREALEQGWNVSVLDCLSYAGNLDNISELIDSGKIRFHQVNIAEQAKVLEILKEENIDYLVNFAAESHVDNSISGPKPFLDTNIGGVYSLLEASKAYWIEKGKPGSFRCLQVSTDEVFGSLGDTGFFTEETPYSPNSPYSATKAAADHLVRAWHETYGLPVLITNCSNNYGQRQFPEKLIPHMICCALEGKDLPVYGDGANVRDWIHVADHCTGIRLTLEKAEPGSSYCFGGRSERKNLVVVENICEILNELRPREDGKSYKEQITFVTDRLGHDWRYAIDDKKAEQELGFTRQYENFEVGLKQTVEWYLDNQKWVEDLKGRKK